MSTLADAPGGAAELGAGTVDVDSAVDAAVERAMRSCTACPELAATRTQVVVGATPAGARVVLLGEAPGAAEDASGKPFVGRSGRLLDEVLGEAGLVRRNVAVLNILKCRPPGNRRPAPVEVANCQGWLERQLEQLAPTVICSLGATATAWILGATGGVRLASVRGQRHDPRPGVRARVPPGCTVVPTYHPSAALRHGPAGAPRAALRADLCLVAALAQAPSPG